MPWQYPSLLCSARDSSTRRVDESNAAGARGEDETLLPPSSSGAIALAAATSAPARGWGVRFMSASIVRTSAAKPRRAPRPSSASRIASFSNAATYTELLESPAADVEAPCDRAAAAVAAPATAARPPRVAAARAAAANATGSPASRTSRRTSHSRLRSSTSSSSLPAAAAARHLGVICASTYPCVDSLPTLDEEEGAMVP